VDCSGYMVFVSRPPNRDGRVSCPGVGGRPVPLEVGAVEEASTARGRGAPALARERALAGQRCTASAREDGGKPEIRGTWRPGRRRVSAGDDARGSADGRRPYGRCDSSPPTWRRWKGRRRVRLWRRGGSLAPRRELDRHCEGLAQGLRCASRPGSRSLLSKLRRGELATRREETAR